MIDLKNEYFLEQTVNGPTRCDTTGETMIDLIFTSIRFLVPMKPVNLNLSDHHLILLIYKKDREEKRPIIIEYRKFSEDNVKLYKTALDVLTKLDVTRTQHGCDITELITNTYSWDEDFGVKDVEKEIRDLDVNKSSGFEEMNTYTMKITLLQLKEEFTFLLNLCRRSCVFPTTVPIPKSGNLKDVNNLRPILLLPVTGKIFERFINRHLNFHMEGNNLYFERQRGFRSGYSTISTAFNLVNYALLHRNMGKIVATVFIDLAKAFNIVNHGILICKLAMLGLSKNFVELLRNYLEKRTQKFFFFFLFNHIYTEGLHAQGDINGGLLLSIYNQSS